MTRTAYTLEIPREAMTASTKYSPAAVLISAVIYAIAVSVSNTIPALVLASIMPLTFLVMKLFPLSRLVSINLVNAVMILTLSLTWPEIRGGLIMGVIIALRVNMILVAFGVMVYPLGTSGMYSAMSALHVPLKLRILTILTLRGVNILRERYETAIISVRLRAPRLRGIMKLKVFAYMTGTVLLDSLLHSENMMKSVKCRGGFGGFIQTENERLSVGDVTMIAGFFAYGMSIAVMNYA